MTGGDFPLAAVHERLGTANASDLEAQVMREVLLEQYPGRTLDSLDEGEWLKAYGEMNARKSTGWTHDQSGDKRGS